MHRILMVFAVAAALAGCTTSGSSPTAPTSSTPFAGTWSGSLVVQGQTATMTWTLTQNGSSVSGPVLVSLPNGIVLMNGALSGAASGSTLTYSIAVGAGGIPSQPACTGQFTGTTMLATTTMTGSYAVAASTCNTGFSSGTFMLSR